MLRIVKFELLFSFMLILAACTGSTGRSTTAEEAIEITNEFWERELPQVNLANLSINTRDMGTKWRITYSPPEGSLGSQWVFEVDKVSGNILNVSGGQ
jgi:hypothetical protein